MTDRCIWVYREMRSGGSWLCNFLSHNLQKRHIFLEHHSQISLKIKPNPSHSKYIFSTHKLEYFAPVLDYDNPIIIKCSRRNNFEQMLSEFFLSLTERAVSNIISDDDFVKFQTMTNQRISRVTKEDVKIYKDRKNQELALFESFVQGLEVRTIYYEDFFDGTKIPDIDLLIKFDETVTKKLPDYKQSVFVNYEEIKEWFYHS